MDGAPKRPKKSQKEGQEDKETFRQLWSSPQAILSLPGTPGLPPGSSMASLAASNCQALEEPYKALQESLKRPSKSLLRPGFRMIVTPVHETNIGISDNYEI